MKSLDAILEKYLSLVKLVAKKGRHQPDREIPQALSQHYLQAKPDLRTRREIIRKASRRIRNKVFDNSPDRPVSNRTQVIANKTMRYFGESMSSVMHGDEESIKQVYDMRKNGHTEQQIAYHMSKRLGKTISVETLYNNVDKEHHLIRPDYHSPNTWHPTLPEHIVAHIYKERAAGKYDGVIAREMNDDITFHRTPRHTEIRYNADHFHMIRNALKKDFKEKHGVGYNPPNAAPLGGVKPAKYVVTPRHIEKMTKHFEKNPDSTVGDLMRAASVDIRAKTLAKTALKKAGITPKKGNNYKAGESTYSTDFHQTLHDMVHKEKMTNPQIVNASEKRLGKKISKGALIGYLHRSDIGPNPNKAPKGNPNWGKYDRKKKRY